MDRLPEVVELLGDWVHRPGPLYRALADALEVLLADGVLVVGERLPAERKLAALLAVSRATVVGAYDELRDRGLVVSHRGSGTRVSRAPARASLASDGRVTGGAAHALIGLLVDGTPEVISLASAVDGAAPELRTAFREVLDHDLAELTLDAGYHPRGLPRLRRAVAALCADAHGLPTTPEQILVTTGATQALSLIALAYLRRGDRVLVEAPGWPGCYDAFRAAGAEPVGVPLDSDGPRVADVARLLATGPRMLYVTPTYQSPTGTLMSMGRRRRLAELAHRHGVVLVEDNAHLTVPPIAAVAPGGAEVLSIGSLAKPVWAGLRIGWIRAHPATIEALARHKAMADLGSPVLDQAVAARLMPDLPRIAADRAAATRVRLDRLGALLADRLPTWRWRRPDGGGALWIELPETDARMFAQVAARHGVEVVPGSTMDPDHGHDGYLRIPATFPEPVLDELVARLARAWAELVDTER